MKKLLCAVLLVGLFAATPGGSAFASDVRTPARIGVLAPIGMDAKDVARWSENVAAAEGKPAPFKNRNTLVIYESLTPMLLDLLTGHIDRFAVSRAVGTYIVASNDTLQLNDNRHKAILGNSVAMLEKDKALMKTIDEAIQAMKKDGTLEKLIQQYITHASMTGIHAVEMPKLEGAETLRVAITGDLPPMDLIRADGMPGGFNTAFLAELSRRIHKNFDLVSVSAMARLSALLSGRVDMVFWVRGAYDADENPLPYPLDKMEGVVISVPYFIDSRVSVSRK